jgi:hypothetical protein
MHGSFGKVFKKSGTLAKRQFAAYIDLLACMFMKAVSLRLTKEKKLLKLAAFLPLAARP